MKCKRLVGLLSGVAGLVGLADERAPITSGYGGWWLDVPSANYNIAGMYLEPMRRSGFNGIDMKIFSTTYGEMEMVELKRIIALVHSYKLDFHAYATPWTPDRKGAWTRNRKGEAGALPAFVNESGETTDRICLADYATFRNVYAGAYIMAELSKTCDISSVKLDLEWANAPLSCYCDTCWKRFAATHPEVSAETLPAARHSLLVEKNLANMYCRAAATQWENVAIAYEREMHGINRELMLGMMPAEDNPFYLPFIRHLATIDTPAVMDSWCMYSGNGYNKMTCDTMQWLRKQNPNNIPMPWFRFNFYEPETISSQAYELQKNGIGYTLYPLSLLQSNANAAGESLPHQYTVTDYWNAFGEANREYEAYRTAAENGRKYESKLKFTCKVLVSDCHHQLIKPLKLTAYAPGQNGAKTSPMMLRHENFFYVEASPQEPVSFELEHVARERPTAIAADIVDPATGKVVLWESVGMGERRTITFPVNQKKVYAVIFNGGNCGPWYQVCFNSKRWGGYGYRDDQNEHFYFFFGATKPYREYSIYLLPNDGVSEFQFMLSGGAIVYKLYTPDGVLAQEGRTKPPYPFRAVVTQKVASKEAGGLWNLKLDAPTTLAQGEGVQNACFNMLKGLSPVFSLAPESMLKIKKEEQ